MQTDFGNSPAFQTHLPARQTAPFVFNCPHAGANYPERFLALSRLDRLSIRQSEDAYVDELFAEVVDLGAPMLQAHFPRAYLDVNREPYELDPKMFHQPLPNYVNIRSARVAAGLGTIARNVAESMQIYNQKLDIADMHMRIDKIYKPYHHQLQQLLSQTVNQFGLAVLIDCHSMPALSNMSHNQQPDIVLGDRHGATCSPYLVDITKTTLEQAGLKVVLNRPYAGGFITRTYGQPHHGVHALQIEISRPLYMNTKTFAKKPEFGKIKSILGQLAQNLLAIEPAALHIQHEAAE